MYPDQDSRAYQLGFKDAVERKERRATIYQLGGTMGRSPFPSLVDWVRNYDNGYDQGLRGRDD